MKRTGATEILSYWLKCPDQVGTYVIKTEIHDGQTKLEEAALDVDVSQTVHSRIIDTILETEATGNVKAFDFSLLRLKIGDIMFIMGRRFYETVKQSGLPSLLPLTGLVMMD